MRKALSALLLAALLLSLFGCAAPTPAAITEARAPSVEAAPEASSEAPTEAETEPPVPEGKLYLTVSTITFSLVGESEDIYLGLLPREDVTWESEDPSIVSVENGVLTAESVGTTTIRATYHDREVSCTAGCLAETREELDSLDDSLLRAPKRLPPEIDLDEDCTLFDDAAIFGDSITYFLWQAVNKNHYLGNLQFITRQGISIHGLVHRYKNLHFRAQEAYYEDIAAQCGAKRIYLALGCLDFQFDAGRDALMESWETLLDTIQGTCPDVELVVISNIPCLPDSGTPSGLNNFIADSNRQLRALAVQKGCGFLDLSAYVQDHHGRLPEIYSYDCYHMNDAGSLVWMKVLRYYAQYESEGGTLS